MHTVSWLLVGALGLGCGAWAQADEADGLSLPSQHVQGRIRLGMGADPGSADLSGAGSNFSRFSGVSVLGDYYFVRSASGEGETSGFRATSGVFLGSRLGLWGVATPATMGGSLVSVERANLSLLPATYGLDSANTDNGTVPYIGFGYSGTSLKGGWGFSADLGLMALNPGGAARLGRGFGSGQSLDDLVRELRLSPVLQLGVSYSF